jgi:hypothetical protein
MDRRRINDPYPKRNAFIEPLIRVGDYLAFLEANTYDGRTRVR